MNSTNTRKAPWAGIVVCTGTCLLSSLGAAQELEGLAKEKTVSNGSKEVAAEGFQQVAEIPKDEVEDATEAKVMAGGLLAAGNSRSNQVSLASEFYMRRQASQLTAIIAANRGSSAPDQDAPLEKTVENYQGQVRYDYFLNKRLAAFASLSARSDSFQGLDLRLNLGPGLAYYPVDKKDMKAWVEAGYDLQHDIRTGEKVDESIADALADAADDDETTNREALSKTATRHNARLFVGFRYKFSKLVGWDSYVEYLQAMQETENFRVNASGALTSQLAGSLSVAVSYTYRFDNNPVGDVRKSDHLAAFNLVYSL